MFGTSTNALKRKHSRRVANYHFAMKKVSVVQNFRQILPCAICIAILIGSFSFLHSVTAHALTSKQIMSECRKKYGKSVTSGYQNKQGKIICTLRTSNKNAMKECRKKYGKSVVKWYREKSGKIVCVTGNGGSSPGSSNCLARMNTMSHGKRADCCRKHYRHLGPIQVQKRRGKWWCVYSN